MDSNQNCLFFIVYAKRHNFPFDYIHFAWSVPQIFSCLVSNFYNFQKIKKFSIVNLSYGVCVYICCSWLCVYICIIQNSCHIRFNYTYSSLVQANKNIPSAFESIQKHLSQLCNLYGFKNLNFGEYQTNRILSSHIGLHKQRTGSEYTCTISKSNKSITYVHLFSKL